MLEVVMRTLILYVTVLIVMRIMGKREIGQISPFDLVVAIIIAELAAIPMEGHIPIWRGILPIVTLLIAEVGVSYLSLKSRAVRKIINGSPSILIQNGVILEREMRSQRYSLDDLMGQLREAGYPDVADVEYAILETSGKLTVIPRSQKRPLTPEDLKLNTGYEGLPTILVMDGEVIHENLKLINLDNSWLRQQLQRAGYNREDDIFYASIDTQGNMFICPKEKCSTPN